MALVTTIETFFDPEALRVREVIGTILSEFRNRQGPRAVYLHKLTVGTWNEPPDFTFKFKFSGGEAELQVYADGTDLEIWKWVWLDEGTAIRHAILSDDWVSKTWPGRFVSGAGQGRVVAIDANYPGAGIEPRDFSEQIAKEMEKTFADDIQKAINRGFDIAESKGKSIGF